MLWKLCPVALLAQIKPREAQGRAKQHLTKAGNLILQQDHLGSQGGKQTPDTPNTVYFENQRDGDYCCLGLKPQGLSGSFLLIDVLLK